MTKARKNPEPEEKPLDGQFDALWGKGILLSAAQVVDKPREVIPLSPQLNSILAGGIPLGSWVSFTGLPKTGKTTTALTLAARFQHMVPEGKVFYLNVEHRLKKKNLQIKGLDTSRERLRIITSSKERLLTGNDFLEMAIHLLKSNPRCLLILDSISALLEKEVKDGGLGTETRGGQAKLLSQFVNLTSSLVPVQESVICGITHMIADTSGHGQGMREKASNRWFYQADIRLKATWAERWTVGTSTAPREIGLKVHWLCLESALGPPGGKCTSHIRFGIGVDRIYEILETARAIGLIETSGAWLRFKFLEDGAEPRSINGSEKAYALLLEHPEYVEVLEKKVQEFLQTGGATVTEEAF